MTRSSFSILVCLFLVAAGCGSTENETREETATAVRPVRYIVLEPVTQTVNQRFSGTAQAKKEAVLSFKVSGTIENIPVKIGDRVSKGDLLARLDETDIRIDVETSQAGLKASQADVKSAQTNVYTTRSNYDRIQKLYENDNVSLSEFEQARGNYETSLASLQAAKSRMTTETSKLQAAKNQLMYTRLTAPFTGIVNSIPVEENEEITPGSPVLTLSGAGNLEVSVSVSDLYIARIRTGMPCQVTFAPLQEPLFDGRVTEVSYGATDAPTYPVTVDILSQDTRLRPGMAAEVRFDLGKSEEQTGLYVPSDGMGEAQGKNFVFVIDRVQGKAQDNTGTIRKQTVDIGPLTEKGFLVKSGLNAGELVATSGLQLLADKMTVKLLDDPVNQW